MASRDICACAQQLWRPFSHLLSQSYWLLLSSLHSISCAIHPNALRTLKIITTTVHLKLCTNNPWASLQVEFFSHDCVSLYIFQSYVYIIFFFLCLVLFSSSFFFCSLEAYFIYCLFFARQKFYFVRIVVAIFLGEFYYFSSLFIEDNVKD